MENKIEKVILTKDEFLIYKLSPAQKEVLALLVKGYNNQEIAQFLNKTVHTVKAQVAIILHKTKLKNRTQLAYLVGSMQDKDWLYNMASEENTIF